MSDELDFDIVDDLVDGQEEATIETNEETTAPSAEQAKEDSEENTSSTKSKKSNWKKMSKALKAKEKRIAELEAKLADKKKDSSDDDDDFEDDFDEDEIEFDKTEFRFFTIENPEAKEYQKEMESMLNQYPNMSFEDALALVKAKTPQPSRSSNDFSSKGSNVRVKKKVGELTQEEFDKVVDKLTPKQILEYERINGRVK